MILQETLLICFSDTALLSELALAGESKALEVQQWSHSGDTAGWAEAWGCQGTAGTCGMPSRGNWCAAGWNVTLQVMMKNACYSIDWSGLFRITPNCTCWNEVIKPILFLQVPQLDINSLPSCVRKIWFFVKLAKNFALELKMQLSGESKHGQ